MHLKKTQPTCKTPKHIAVIMDGNRRWARANGVDNLAAYRKGVDKLYEFCSWCSEAGVEAVTAYAFSLENWQRSLSEVAGIKSLIADSFSEKNCKLAVERLNKCGARFNFFGSVYLFGDGMRERLEWVKEQTANNNSLLLSIALSYSGRDEITRAFNRLASQALEASHDLGGSKGGDNTLNITEDDISKELYTHNIPDPDLLIRTGGEQRLSNFMLWQLSYTELFFCSKPWPDFSQEDLGEAIRFFGSQKRNFGK